MSAIRLFEGPGPRVFAAPVGRPLADAVAEGVLARLAAAGGGPERLLEVEILVSTRRALRAMRSAFARASGGVALGPRLRALDDPDPTAEPDEDDDAPGPAVEPLARLLDLTTLVRALLEAAPGLASPRAAPALASDLAALLDELQGAGLGLDALDRLDAAATGALASHWALSAQFLAILRTAWPARLAELGRLDPGERRRRLTAATARAWVAAPPSRPVLVVGSPTDAVALGLMALVARAPQGAAILPGLDPETPADVAEAVASGAHPDHPQHAPLALLAALGLGLDAVAPWAEATDGRRRARLRLVGQALRPAPVTDVWRREAAAIAADAAAATEAVTLLEAAGPREEAQAIALALREALETPGRSAALVTADRVLARRVAAELARWGVDPDDSSGRPLPLTPPGLYLRLLLEAAAPDASASRLMALLGHPLCRAGHARGRHLRLKRRLEREILRAETRPPTDLSAWVAAARALDAADLAPWLTGVAERIAPLVAALGRATPLHEVIAAHRAAATALSEGPPEAPEAPLFDKAAGRALAAFLDRFEAAAADFGPIEAADYGALLTQAIGAEAVREPYGRHARVAILGPLEARMLSADLVVIGGLVEGVWPRAPQPDAWMGRDMRRLVGLPPLEARIGLSASDFVQAAMADAVILSRPRRKEGAPTVPSRWLVRLETLLGGVAPDRLAAMRARGEALAALAARLDRAAAIPPERRPAPTPPLAARPRTIRVTEVETLIRDPYAVYARRVLRLEPLDGLDDPLDARDRGRVLHALAEAVAREAADPARFDALADDLLAPFADAPMRRAIWRARAAALRDWLLAGDAARRAEGRIAALEADGALTIETKLGSVALRARADRIDRLADGTYALYDLKTGEPPTDKQVATFAKQLPLEAAILARAGFEDAPPGPTSRLAYLGLTGGRQGGLERVLALDPTEAADDALAGLVRLLDAYADPAQPYPSRARPTRLIDAGPYDHLARVGEWAGAGDEAEDGADDDGGEA